VTPAIYTWNGEAMVPLPRFLPLCNRQFVFGERYRLSEFEERSASSHSHYFARLNEVWTNLPEPLMARFPTPERLRKWALCRTEYRNERRIACHSKADAYRIAAFMQSQNLGDDHYVEIAVHRRVIIEITPKSQSYKAMGKKDFQDSKQQVLDIITDLIEITPQQLADNAGKAA
jgi:hypothetical protein